MVISVQPMSQQWYDTTGPFQQEKLLIQIFVDGRLFRLEFFTKGDLLVAAKLERLLSSLTAFAKRENDESFSAEDIANQLKTHGCTKAGVRYGPEFFASPIAN